MNTKWSLENIYKSIDCPEFKEDLIRYEEHIKKMNNFANANFTCEIQPKIIEEYIKYINESIELNKLAIFINLSLSVDTENSTLLKLMDKLEALSALESEHEALFSEYLNKADDIDRIIADNAYLKEHRYFLENAKRESEYSLGTEAEKAISQMKLTGSVQWQKQWEQLTSSLEVKLDDEYIPLSVCRNHAYSKNSVLRKKAYEAELEAYKKIEAPIAFCLNSIKGEVNNLAQLRGIKSVLENTVLASGMDMPTFNAMMSALKESLCEFEEYFIKKAEYLGHKNGLPFYDLFAPIGKTEKDFTLEEARDIVISAFSEFSQDMGDFAKKAFEESFIDLMPKKNKMGGAFCEAVYAIKESRVLTNFSGSFSDIVTIAHELGHAYHDKCVFSQSAINSQYPMPIAETASTFCEGLVTSYYLKRCKNDDERLQILEMQVSDAGQVIADIYSRFLFESEIFEKRADGPLSVEEIQEIMLKAQKCAYGKGLDSNYLHKDMWVCKVHYYDADYNFYNFPYAFGLLLSKALYQKAKEDAGFSEKYSEFFALTGKMSTADAAKKAGLDLTSESFWKNSTKILSEEISTLKDLMQSNK